MGILKSIRDKIYYYTIKSKEPIITLSVRDIYLANCNGRELLRWDVAVKYLAIENYYNKNDYGFKLYAKMQNARTGKDVAETAIANFKDLIISWEEKGYMENSCIYVDYDLTLQNGAHRLAMAIYHGLESINAHTLHRNKPADFGENFFIEKLFYRRDFSDKKQDISAL